MRSIIIIGAGQLGSRHLQALARSSMALGIDVFDPSPDSLQTAQQRWNEMPSSLSKASFSPEMPSGKKYDMAIIATTALVRADVTKRFLSLNETGYILFEKFLFTRVHEYFEIGELLQKKNITAWVNCARRMHSVFAELKPHFQGPLKLSFSGGEWGLACNSIHLADLTAFLSGQNDFIWNTDELDHESIPTKRQGYIEFSGSLVGCGSDGTRIHLHSRVGSSMPPLMELWGDRATVRLDESNGQGLLYRKTNNWHPEPLAFKVPFQSELTHLAVEEVFTAGRCALPSYQESAKLHLALLCAFLQHWVVQGNSADSCPIT